MEDIFDKQKPLISMISDEIINEIIQKKEIKKTSKVHTDGPWVYFIMAGSEKWSPIKIGFTTDILKRFEQIKTSTHANINLIAAITGSIELEKSLHREFFHDKIKGEWFRQTNALLKKIDDLYTGNNGELNINLILSKLNNIIKLDKSSKIRTERFRELVKDNMKIKFTRKDVKPLVESSTLPVSISKNNGHSVIKGIGEI